MTLTHLPLLCCMMMFSLKARYFSFFDKHLYHADWWTEADCSTACLHFSFTFFIVFCRSLKSCCKIMLSHFFFCNESFASSSCCCIVVDSDDFDLHTCLKMLNCCAPCHFFNFKLSACACNVFVFIFYIFVPKAVTFCWLVNGTEGISIVQVECLSQKLEDASLPDLWWSVDGSELSSAAVVESFSAWAKDLL